MHVVNGGNGEGLLVEICYKAAAVINLDGRVIHVSS